LTENRILEVGNPKLIPLLFGEHNTHLNHIEQKLGISIADRGNRLTLSGEREAVSKAEDVLQSMLHRLDQKQDVGLAEIDAALRFIENKPNGKKGNGSHAMVDENIVVRTRRKSISPRSPNQAAYIDAIRKHDMVFGLGPAGTGKTYLAVAAGVAMYLEGQVERLVFCRPALEAGERLGFLPGDMKEKVDPYLRPIYDALHDMLPWEDMLRKMEQGEIEIAPLAFMRGRTLANAFVILDEAQNTTEAQMKMFLTRMGEASHMVITGDMTQSDLPKNVRSGLNDAVEILQGVEGVKFIEFTRKDVIRHPLVGRIIEAYDKKR
jgi:phosphate starvation-inducible PhoH-like protein